MKSKKIAVFCLLCSTLLILNGCQKIWYLFLNSAVDIVPSRFQIEEDGKKLSIPIVASLPLDKVHHNTQYLIIAIHGGGLNAQSTFETTLETIKALNLPESRFLVLAPQIIEGVRLKEKGLLFWDQTWREGGLSLSTGLNKDSPRVSSFEVVDRLIDHSVKRNPGVDRVLLWVIPPEGNLS